MTAKPTTPPLALLVQAEQRYDIKTITAHVVLPQANGELHNPAWYRFDADRAAGRFDGFQASAYVGHTSPDLGDDRGEVWGFGYRFDGVSIDDVERATSIAGVMRTVQRGLAKIQDAEGYVHDGDVVTYLVRIMRVLKIKDLYVRNTVEQRDRSGERYRKVSGSTLQYWISNVSDLARKGQFEQATGGRG